MIARGKNEKTIKNDKELELYFVERLDTNENINKNFLYKKIFIDV